MTSSLAYQRSPQVDERLTALVSRIEAAPGEIIDVRRLDAHQQAIDSQQLLRTLPEGLSLDDLAGIHRLALLTECATESYAAAIRQRARLFDAEWLSRFIENVWTQDELTHHTPYKLILLNLGFAEADLDRQSLRCSSANRAKRPQMAWAEIRDRLETMGPSFHASSMLDIFQTGPDGVPICDRAGAARSMRRRPRASR